VQRADQPGLAECRDQAVKGRSCGGGELPPRLLGCRPLCRQRLLAIAVGGSTGDAAWRNVPQWVEPPQDGGQRLVSVQVGGLVGTPSRLSGGTRQPRLGVGPARHRVATIGVADVPTACATTLLLIGKGRVARRGELHTLQRREGFLSCQEGLQCVQRANRVAGVENGQQAAAPAGSPLATSSRPNGSGPATTSRV